MRLLLFICWSLLFLLSLKSNAQNLKLSDQLGASDQKAGDNLGISVDISDSLLVAGAWWSEGNSGINSSGAAYVYHMNPDGTFDEVTKLTSPNPESLGYFGFRVAISGNNILVGAFNEDHSGLGNAGRVYAYGLDDEGDWDLTDTLKIISTENADYFGYDISMIDGYTLIGAYRQSFDENGENQVDQAGAAYLYKRTDPGKWTMIKKIVAQNRATDDNFGRHVSMDKSGMVISAFNKKSNGGILEAGVAYVYNCDEECDFDEIQGEELIQIEASDPRFGQQLGWDVGISGNWIAIGKRSDAVQPDGGFVSSTGSVYFFKLENGSWVEKQKVYAGDYAGQAFFGERIAIEDGICVIGAGGESYDEEGENFQRSSGAAYVFELNEDEVWVQKQKLVGIGRSTDDLYANEGLAIDKNRLVVGAWRADTVGSEAIIDGGAVYIYERDGDLPSAVENMDPEVEIVLANNPSEGLISLITNEDFNGVMQVHTLDGALLHHQKLTINQRMDLDISNLDPGLYLIRIFNYQGSQIFKWVKN